MASETKGPWRASMTATEWRIDGSGIMQSVHIHEGERLAGQFFAAERDAAHIVACVNAVRQTKEAAEAMGGTFFIASNAEVDRQRARADALAAENERLRGALNAAVTHLDGIIYGMGDADNMRARAAHGAQMARAALAGKGE